MAQSVRSILGRRTFELCEVQEKISFQPDKGIL